MKRYRKTYKTRSNETVIHFKLDSVTVNATFRNGNIRDDEWAKLVTDSPVVQLVIEKSPLYGKQILLDSVQEIEEDAKEEAVSKVDDVTTLDEARKYLVENFGIDRSRVAAPNSIKSAMNRFKVSFPNLKI